MNNVVNRKKEEGFTIIEVLIVLAIAGLIILIVFLAVPALQRNSRNTQRKNDVASIGGALNEYINNNSGQLPADNNAFKTQVLKNAKFSYFDVDQANLGNVTSVTFTKNTSATGATGTPTGSDSVLIYTYRKCDNNAATGTGATSRSVIALYNAESGNGGTALQCQEL